MDAIGSSYVQAAARSNRVPLEPHAVGARRPAQRPTMLGARRARHAESSDRRWPQTPARSARPAPPSCGCSRAAPPGSRSTATCCASRLPPVRLSAPSTASRRGAPGSGRGWRSARPLASSAAIGGLDRREAERVAAAVREDAARAAEALSPQLTRLDSRLSRFHATDRYIRKSLSSGLQADIAEAVQHSAGALTRAHLPPRAADALSRLKVVASHDAFEAAREEANARFVAARAPAVVSAASGVLSSAADRRAGRGESPRTRTRRWCWRARARARRR